MSELKATWWVCNHCNCAVGLLHGYQPAYCPICMVPKNWMRRSQHEGRDEGEVPETKPVTAFEQTLARAAEMLRVAHENSRNEP